MPYCLNPACPQPENPDGNRTCHGCGEELANSSREYRFRVRYRVVRLLGEGAFGRTYLAEDLDLMGEPRAIKKFIAQGQGTLGEKAKELFVREAQQLYELSHPQIPQLYAYFQQDNLLFLVEKFIEGENLRQELSREGKFSQEKIAFLLRELLGVLDYLHSQKILHRDLKPENIMRRRADGKLVLVDFGAAKVAAETRQNQPGTALYTPGYAAAEQMAGRPKPASDLYSLGVTCIRLLTGCLPATDIYGNLEDPLYDDDRGCWLWRQQLQQQGRQVSEPLGAILEKMLQPLPINRYQSAQEVLSALTALTMKHRILLPAIAVPQTGNSRLPVPSDAASKLPTLKQFTFEVTLLNSRGEVSEYQLKQASYFTEFLTTSEFILPKTVPFIDMIYVPGGSFIMGAPPEEQYGRDSERPQHEVTIPSFFLGKYPVTQKQWQAIASLPKVKRDLLPDPAYFKGENRPVEQVSWHDASEFCQRLSRETGREYRLPSEAEWEYACRAITNEEASQKSKSKSQNLSYPPFYFGETITAALVNCDGNGTYAEAAKGQYREQTTPVGQFPPNAWGLYDMHGNVWEWCADTWHDNYEGAPADGSAWLAGSEQQSRLLRGGSWSYYPRFCRSASRDGGNPDNGGNNLGLRVVMSLRT